MADTYTSTVPMVSAVQVKKTGGDSLEAKLQLGIWQAAALSHLHSMFIGADGALPASLVRIGWTVVGHSWDFYITWKHGVRGPTFLDIKPQNILLSGFDNGSHEINKLSACIADLGSASKPSNHTISPKSFRSPEAWLGLDWGPATDIWSLGAVISSLMMGPHGELFGSHAPTDEEKEYEMLYRLHSMTGPFPESLLSRASEKWKSRMAEYRLVEEEHGPGMSWRWVMQGLNIREEDGAFVERILIMDPAERPTASALLADPWLKEG
ncbi:hypothetical protein MBLNU459_g0405t1 [Dothideomycetes sp. NU459]